MISLTVLGAPQWHNQRNDNLLISEWQKHANKYKFNAVYGFGLNGQRKVAGYNKFHKPQLSLNHYWTSMKNPVCRQPYMCLSVGEAVIADKETVLIKTAGMLRLWTER